MYLGISEDVSRAKTNNSLKFRRAAPRLSAQMYLVLSKSGFTAARLLRSAATDHMRARGGHIDIGGPDSPIARIVVASGGEDDLSLIHI